MKDKKNVSKKKIEKKVKFLEKEVLKLKSELSEKKEKLLRFLADIENIKRRSELEVEKAFKYGNETLLKSLLPVIDSLEKGLFSMRLLKKSYTEGIRLTLKIFFDILKKNSVKKINPLRKKFDPNLHEAISIVKDKKMKDETVISVIQNGYTLSGRLLRAAKVIISRK